MLEVHAILQRQRCNENITKKTGTLSDAYEADIDTILKMLADYYKTGEVSGKAYGTFAGKELVNKQ